MTAQLPVFDLVLMVPTAFVVVLFAVISFVGLLEGEPQPRSSRDPHSVSSDHS